MSTPEINPFESPLTEEKPARPQWQFLPALLLLLFGLGCVLFGSRQMVRLSHNDQPEFSILLPISLMAQGIGVCFLVAAVLVARREWEATWLVAILGMIVLVAGFGGALLMFYYS